MLQEFKNFASRENFILRSNTLELAIGLTLIFALEKLISSLVLDIVLPAISLMGALDFSNRFIALSPSVSAANLTDAKKQGAILAYGDFVTDLVNFLIIGLVLVFVLKLASALKSKPVEPISTAPSSPGS